jgi:predicted Rossmann fold flavoprotein
MAFHHIRQLFGNQPMQKNRCVVVIGGGAAGFFGAIACAQANSEVKVMLLEKHRQLLSKVRISGGGRCNVTHACFDPSLLVKHYPRGNKALIGPFQRFQPRDTVEWFTQRGVVLKTEEDGRMFPETDSSQTIIDCLLEEARKSGVEIYTETGAESVQKTTNGFLMQTDNGSMLEADSILIATGSSKAGYTLAETFGHHIIPTVPSLFTFNVPSSPLLDLSGISVKEAHLKIAGTSLEQSGPLLLTHWGFSGPAVLKLSAWGARILHGMDYKADLLINWTPQYKQDQLLNELLAYKKSYPSRVISSEALFELPRNLWKKLVLQAQIDGESRWSAASNKQLAQLVNTLHSNRYSIDGKTTYKQEFVTSGGVKTDEINFKTMESRLQPGLHFAGEVLDIDGVTGGFNFQNAWTTGWIAGQAMATST